MVHYDPPADHKDYLHRSGRTARAGARGTVLSLLLPEQVREAARVHERAGVAVGSVPVGPGHEAVTALGRSGVPIVVREEPVAPPAARPAPGRGRRGPARRPRRDRGATAA